MSLSDTIRVGGTWLSVFEGEARDALEILLPDYIKTCRWFGAKARTIESVRVLHALPLAHEASQSFITIIEVDYTEGQPQNYMLPLAFAPGEQGREIGEQTPHAVVARLTLVEPGEDGVLFDAARSRDFALGLLDAIAQSRRSEGEQADIIASPTRAFGTLSGSNGETLEPSVMRAEQSNTSIVYGDRLILKLFRRFERGLNPDLEIGRFLTEKGFANIPSVAGAIELRTSGAGTQEPATLALLQGFVPNEGDAWQYTLDSLGGYFGRALSQQINPETIPPGRRHLLDLMEVEAPAQVRETIGAYLESARLLGRRTAEMHIALASEPNSPDFAPEPFTADYQHSLWSSMLSMTSGAFATLGVNLLMEGGESHLPAAAQAEARAIIERRDEAMQLFGGLNSGQQLSAMRIRCHGDYHLGQVLYTGSDFMIIDFEGEPARSLEERRRKHSPLKDVAGMLRSFHYAAYAAMFSQTARGMMEQIDLSELEQWTGTWHTWVSAAFLGEYMAVAGGKPFLPQSRGELQTLLDAYLLEKAIYELLYELNNRPDWARIPLQGISQLLQTQA